MTTKDPATEKPGAPRGRWMSVDEAGALLGVSVITLRRMIERNARRLRDGAIESVVDGVRARRFGRRWRVALDRGWLEPLGLR